MLITDGKQTRDKGPYTPPEIAADSLKDLGVIVYAIGVSKDVDTLELEKIASSPEQMVVSPSFAELAAIASSIRTSLCEGLYAFC